MSLSDNLSQLNWQRNQDFQLPFTTENARPAVYTFNGDVYQGLDVATLAPKHLQALQSKLRILSGLFGVLRPLDLIQPYRLEMGTGLGVRGKKDLYAFWKSKIAPQLNSELEEGALLVNLASNEYFKTIVYKLAVFVKCSAFENRISPITCIVKQGVAQMFHVYPYLMGTPCF